jgi:hypothetical protein
MSGGPANISEEPAVFNCEGNLSEITVLMRYPMELRRTYKSCRELANQFDLVVREPARYLDLLELSLLAV